MSTSDLHELPIFDIVKAKLDDGRLPQDDSIPRIWAGFGNGQTCAACEHIITSSEFLMEPVESGRGWDVNFHVRCYYVWNALRRGGSRKGPARAVPRHQKNPE